MLTTEVLKKYDLRINDGGILAAKKKKVQCLLERGTVKIVPKSKIPPDANVLPALFVLAIRNSDGKEVYKARLIMAYIVII